jgi:hypothetical protein
MWANAGNSPFKNVFQFLHALWVFEQTLSLSNHHRKTLGRVKSGDQDDQKPCLTMQSPQNFLSKAVVFAVWAVTPTW